MSEVLKNILLVLAGAIGLAIIFWLVVSIGCSVNGLKFGQQVCEWFGGSGAVIQPVAEAVAELPIQ